MTLRHLRIFVAVCIHGSITKAAIALHMAQPSISLAIHELEDYYQICLFDRISRKLYITPIGERFLTYATHITSMFEEMEDTMKDWEGKEHIRVGSSITIANSLLCDYLAQYQTRFPQRNVQVLIENSSILEAKILTNELDLALMEGIPTHPQILKEAFFQDELVILCANEHPMASKENLTLQDIKNENFLLREKGSGTREIVDSIMKIHDFILQPKWESASTKALVKGVQHNFGISILPYQMVKEDLKQHTISRITLHDISFKRDYYIIYHANKYQNAAMKDFISICSSKIKG